MTQQINEVIKQGVDNETSIESHIPEVVKVVGKATRLTQSKLLKATIAEHISHFPHFPFHQHDAYYAQQVVLT